MQLTQKQEWLIDRYLRAFGQALGDIDEAIRDRAEATVRARILQSLRRFPIQPHRDEDLAAVFRELGGPGQQAQLFLAQHGPAPALTLSNNRVWLGVCAGIAERFGLQARQVRAAAILIGMTGPLALAVYLVLYFHMYMATREPPAMKPWKVAGAAAAAGAAAIAMDAGTRLAAVLLDRAYEFAALRALPALGRWDWLRDDRARLLAGAILMVAMMSALSTLPMSDGWDAKMRRAKNAVLILYAAILSFGLACHFAGLLLEFIGQVG